LLAAVGRSEVAQQKLILQELHDRKGTEATLALGAAVEKVDPALQAQARDLLAARLSRMTAATLERYLEHESAAIRRGAAAAVVQKKEKPLAGKLIGLLEDSDLQVADAAHSALVELTGQDFGKFIGATKVDRFVTVKRWKTWWEQNK
jgi:HEAT repeat protein